MQSNDLHWSARCLAWIIALARFAIGIGLSSLRDKKLDVTAFLAQATLRVQKGARCFAWLTGCFAQQSIKSRCPCLVGRCFAYQGVQTSIPGSLDVLPKSNCSQFNPPWPDVHPWYKIARCPCLVLGSSASTSPAS